MKKITFILLLILIVGCKGSAEKRFEKSVQEITLKNGMHWFLVDRGYAPVFAGVIRVNTGGLDEEYGKTGLSHFLEHMSFKGSTEIGTKNYEEEKIVMDKVDELALKDPQDPEIKELIKKQKQYIVSNELWDIFTRNGARNLNAYTSKDATTYLVEMPSSKLELWLYLTSEMISNPVFREFYSERDVITEEYRMSIENNPRGMIYKRLLEIAFKNSPYGWATIGKKQDVVKLSRDDLRKFHTRTYTPECMSGAIVGKIDIHETRELLEKYYGKLKSDNNVCVRNIKIDTPDQAEQRADVTYDAEPSLLIGFHKPTVPHIDDYVFDVLSYALCEGESSRFEQVLVKDKKIAKSITCFNSFPGTRLHNLFVIYAEPFNDNELADLENAINTELDLLIKNGLTGMELDKVKNQMKMTFLDSLDSNLDLAQMITYMQLIAGNWKYIISHSENIDKLTNEDLIRVSKKYFTPQNRVVVKLMRK